MWHLRRQFFFCYHTLINILKEIRKKHMQVYISKYQNNVSPFKYAHEEINLNLWLNEAGRPAFIASVFYRKSLKISSCGY